MRAPYSGTIGSTLDQTKSFKCFTINVQAGRTMFLMMNLRVPYRNYASDPTKVRTEDSCRLGLTRNIHRSSHELGRLLLFGECGYVFLRS